MPDNVPLKAALTPLEYKIDSAEGVVRKLNEKIQFASSINSLTDRQNSHFEAVGAAIGVYDNEVANQYVENDKVQKLVDLLYQNKEFTTQILPDEETRYNKLTANMEAYLKGIKFAPDTFPDSIPNKEELQVFKTALDDTLLELKNNKISRGEYGKIILEKVKEKLSNNIPPASEELLKEAENIVKKADKNKPEKNTDLTQDETKIKEAFENTLGKLSEFLEKNIEINKSIKQSINVIQENLSPNISGEQNQKVATTLLPVVSKLPPEELQEKGSKIVKDFAPLLDSDNPVLVNGTKKALTELDPKYLVEYSNVIIDDLKKVNEKGISTWEKFKSIFNPKKDYLAEKVEKAVDKYIAASDEYSKKEINNKIFEHALGNKEMAEGLTKFVNENHQAKLQLNSKYPNLFPDATNPAKIEAEDVNKVDLAELRKTAPLAFDQALFGSPKETPIPQQKKVQEMVQGSKASRETVKETQSKDLKPSHVDNLSKRNSKDSAVGRG